MRTTGRVILTPTIVKVGYTVVITCKADIQAVWKYNKGPLPMDVLTFTGGNLPSYINVKTDVNDTVLVIQKAEMMHSGIYTCIGEDSEISHFTEDIQLTVRGKCFVSL